MAKANNTAAKRRGKVRYFLHWFRTDYGRKVVVLVGDPSAAAREIRRHFQKDVATMLVSTFLDAYEGYRWGELEDDESGREKKCDWGYSVVWFPLVPHIGVLVHELCHATQDVCADMGIEDREFFAYTLDLFVQYFHERMEKDRKIPFDQTRRGNP